MGKHLGRAEATAAGEWSNFVIFLLERGVKRTRCSAQMLYAVFSNLRRLILVPREIITLTLVGSGLFLWVVFFFSVRSKSQKNLRHQNLYKREQGIEYPQISEAERCHALIPHISLHLIREFTFFFSSAVGSIYIFLKQRMIRATTALYKFTHLGQYDIDSCIYVQTDGGHTRYFSLELLRFKRRGGKRNKQTKLQKARDKRILILSSL